MCSTSREKVISQYGLDELGGPVAWYPFEVNTLPLLTLPLPLFAGCCAQSLLLSSSCGLGAIDRWCITPQQLLFCQCGSQGKSHLPV